MIDRFEQMFVQPFVSNGTIEAFNVGVLRGFSGLNKQQPDALFLRPGLELGTSHFAAIVRANDLWFATPLNDLIQRPGDAL